MGFRGRLTQLDTFRAHWPEYAIEALLLGLFMISACGFAAILEHPASPVRQAIDTDWIRRSLMGAAMGATAIVLITSRLGQRSGAHMNPATTLTFWRLGKVAGSDAAGYVAGQFLGGAGGILLMSLLLTQTVSHPAVHFVVTQPGRWGSGWAFAAEVAISFVLMTTVLHTSNHSTLSRYTPVFAGMLVMCFIAIEAPVSGMSMNPARTFGSALMARLFNNLWIYFLAPPVGMLLAAELYVRTRGWRRVFCAKLHHHNTERCIFRCRFGELGEQ